LRSELRVRLEVRSCRDLAGSLGHSAGSWEGYRAWLPGRGYSPSGVIRSLIALGHLGRWLEREALAVDRLTAGAVSAFLAEYRSDRGRSRAVADRERVAAA
jgi:hypothetical protein